MRAQLRAYRPELAGTPAAREAARFLVANPPLPLALRPAYLPIAGAAVALLPRGRGGRCACRGCPSPRPRVARAGGELVTRTIRWALPGT